MIHKIYDEDGFIALVNAATYQSFVDEDWNLEQLMAHFATEMGQHHLVVWQTSNMGGGVWNVTFLDAPSTTHAYREFTDTITVTDGKLYLTDYTDLTMAAQFRDERIPSINNEELKVPLANGDYNITIRQMVDPDNVNADEFHAPHFEVVLQRRAAAPPAGNSGGVHWSTV